MENIETLEQPQMQISDTADVNEQINNQESAMVDDNLQNGSNFGKFKDATSLLSAYNNLEKEFTKKSQKLSELLKQNNLSQTETSSNNETLPMFKESSWQNKVSKFFNQKPEAKQFAREISNTLIQDKELAKNNNCLEYAYALAKSKNIVEPAKLYDDPKFMQEIMENENIKNKIIAEYLKSVSSNNHNLRLISGEPKFISPTQSQNKPKSIKEASNILRKLLQ